MDISSTTLLVVRGDYCCVDPEVIAREIESGSHRLDLEDGGKRLLCHPPHQLGMFTSDGYSLIPDDVNHSGACAVIPFRHCAPVGPDTRISARATPKVPALASLK